MEKLEVGGCSEDVVMASFTNGLKDKDMIKSLYTQPHEDFENIMRRVKTYTRPDEQINEEAKMQRAAQQKA